MVKITIYNNQKITIKLIKIIRNIIWESVHVKLRLEYRIFIDLSQIKQMKSLKYQIMKHPGKLTVYQIMEKRLIEIIQVTISIENLEKLCNSCQ